MIKYLFLFSILLKCNKFCAQSFTIDVSPSSLTIVQGNTGTLNVTGLPTGGYNASIQLSMSNSCFKTSDIVFTPTYMNAPYNGSIQLNNSNQYLPGSYELIIKGENGPITSYDTVQVTIHPNFMEQWYHFNLNKFGFSGYYKITDVKIDSQNNYWFSVLHMGTGAGGLGKYDGTVIETWKNNSHEVYDLCGNLLSSNPDPAIPAFSHGVFCMEIDSLDHIWFFESFSKKINEFAEGSGILYQSPASAIDVGDMAVLDFATRKFYFATTSGLLYFDGSLFTQYATSNSPLPSNNCATIDVDASGVLWIAMDAGLVKLQGGFWTVYNTSNSGIATNTLFSINASQPNGIIFSGSNGINKFDNTTFSVFSAGTGYENITYDQNGEIWATNLFDLKKLDPSAVVSTFTAATLKYAPFDIPNHIAVDHNNNIVVSAYQSALGMYSDLMIRNPRLLLPNGVHENILVKKNFIVYPNPAKADLKIAGLAKGAYMLQLIDAMGKVQVTQLFYADAEVSEVSLEDKSLLPGIYLLRVSNSLSSFTEKLIIE